MTTDFYAMNFGDKLPNGATLLRWGCVSCETGQVIVLATWKQEFVTWRANLHDTRTTGTGHYFMFGPWSSTSPASALQEALRDYHARLAGLSAGLLRCPPRDLDPESQAAKQIWAMERKAALDLLAECYDADMIDEAA